MLPNDTKIKSKQRNSLKQKFSIKDYGCKNGTKLVKTGEFIGVQNCAKMWKMMLNKKVTKNDKNHVTKKRELG